MGLAQQHTAWVGIQVPQRRRANSSRSPSTECTTATITATVPASSRGVFMPRRPRAGAAPTR